MNGWEKLKYYGLQRPLRPIFPRTFRTTGCFELKKKSYLVPRFGYLVRWQDLIENSTPDCRTLKRKLEKSESD